MIFVSLVAASLALIVLGLSGYLLARGVKARRQAIEAASFAAVADTLANAETWIDLADIEDQEPEALFGHDGTPSHW